MHLPTDETLLQQFAQPSTRDSAYTALVRKYQERLYWHIRRMVVNHSDADDVLQNVFLKVWKGLDQFREQSSLYTWLYRIATNECLRHLESRQRQASHQTGTEAQTEAALGSLRQEPGFDAKKLEWRLQMAIKQLPEKQQLVFNLRYFDEMPYGEMAAVLGTSEGALKASYHHAAKKIEAYLLNYPD